MAASHLQKRHFYKKRGTKRPRVTALARRVGTERKENAKMVGQLGIELDPVEMILGS